MNERDDIGSTVTDIFPEQFARPFRPLRQEIIQVLSLGRPRFRHSSRVASIKINEVCNFHCTYCTANNNHGVQLSTKELYRVEANIAEVGTQFMDLTGGEVLLRKDLPDLVAHSNKLGMITTLNTNGGIKKEKIEDEYQQWFDLAEAGLYGAYFSYDGVGEKSDPRVIHLAAFLVNTLHIYGGVRTVVAQDNLDKVYDIGERCMRNNVFFQAVPAVALGGESSATPDDFRPLDDSGRLEYIQIIKELSKIRGPFAKFLRVENSYLKRVVDPSSPVWHCKDPSSHWLFVDAQGNTRVCNDRALPEKFSLTGEQNPLLTKEFHQAVERESKKCGGCSWYCNWEGNRAQFFRGLSELPLYLTIGSLT